MKVKTTYSCNEDYQDFYEIEVDGVSKVSIGYMEPEDASLSRDLNFVFSIPELMHRAWEAGKNGEPFEVENIGE